MQKWLGVRFHRFRSTRARFCSKLQSPTLIASSLGHSNTNTVKYYVDGFSVNQTLAKYSFKSIKFAET